MKPKYYSVSEEAKRLRISDRHLWNQIRAKDSAIPHYRVGRRVLLIPEEVDAAITRHFGPKQAPTKPKSARSRKEVA